MIRKRLLIAAPFIWAAIVFMLHAVHISPNTESSFRIPHFDKVVHFTMFCALAFLSVRARMVGSFVIKPLFILFVIVLCLSYGGLMEFLQGRYFNDRDADVFDWIADAVGTFAGVTLAQTRFLSNVFQLNLRK